ncbi:MAG: hypothetical protein ACR2JG_09810 [Geodermatophilaceae bacterium]
MTTSPYTEYLRHHYEAKPAHSRAGHRQTDRLLAPWRRHRTYTRRISAPAADPRWH